MGRLIATLLLVCCPLAGIAEGDPRVTRWAQSGCSACLARCQHLALVCQNSNASAQICQHNSFLCVSACRRETCAPGATQPPAPAPLVVPQVR
jgi:hypothetical protein